MMRNFNVLLIIIFFNFSSYLVCEENLEKELKVYKNLRCLVCQGQSVADSNSDFAQTLKLVVKDQVESGKTEEEIYDFLINKYGEWIVYKPRFSLNNSLLWMLPYLILFFGGIIILNLFKKRKNNRLN
jgi:cytochrome c-type biogenesis protein CcmH|tara:strand:- start:1267 stop:1650 length:384 start_codon:yes stop_codon:yes gene_type:complete